MKSTVYSVLVHLYSKAEKVEPQDSFQLPKSMNFTYLTVSIMKQNVLVLQPQPCVAFLVSTYCICHFGNLEVSEALIIMKIGIMKLLLMV